MSAPRLTAAERQDAVEFARKVEAESARLARSGSDYDLFPVYTLEHADLLARALLDALDAASARD